LKYLIVGLGNPGEQYNNTRHNIGFRVLDALAEKSGLSFADKRYGFVTTYQFKGRKFVLLKPSTFMNLSGKAVRYWLQKEKLDTGRLLIITDDVNLPFGTIRMRKKGSDGGHNGLRSIIEILGTVAFSRLRFGIGKDFYPGEQVDYVLNEWSEEETENLPERFDMCIKAIQAFGTVGIDAAMNQFNNK
jgi:PTH1 family peptidyl-tRNA hydrolase